jgi:hypothetical protein
LSSACAVSIIAKRDDGVVGVLRVVGAAIQQRANRPKLRVPCGA